MQVNLLNELKTKLRITWKFYKTVILQNGLQIQEKR